MVEPWPNYPSFSQTTSHRYENPSCSVPNYTDQYRLPNSYTTVTREIWSALRTIHWPLKYTCCTWWRLYVSNTFLSSRHLQGDKTVIIDSWVHISTYTVTWHKILLVLLFHKRDHAPFAHPWNYVEKLMVIYNRLRADLPPSECHEEFDKLSADY